MGSDFFLHQRHTFSQRLIHKLATVLTLSWLPLFFLLYFFVVVPRLPRQLVSILLFFVAHSIHASPVLLSGDDLFTRLARQVARQFEGL